MDTQTPGNFVSALRSRLIETGATQAEIAAAVGVGQSTISRFLRGTASMRIDNFENLLAFVQRAEELKRAGLISAANPGRRGAPRGLRGKAV